MKKLLASGCCILGFQSFSQVSPDIDIVSERNGRRVLIKAISAMIHADSNRKVPKKQIHLPNVESL